MTLTFNINPFAFAASKFNSPPPPLFLRALGLGLVARLLERLLVLLPV
jgi:hypothetical protein